MERPRGAWIVKVYQSSPADKAGIRSGDVVLRFGGVDVIDLNHLINMVSMAAVGESAEVVVWRERREVKLTVTVGDRERTLTHEHRGARRCRARSVGTGPPTQPPEARRRALRWDWSWPP